MRVHHTVCCGIDVHKKTVTACLMWGPADQELQLEIRRFGTMTSELKSLAEWLKQAHCEVAAMDFMIELSLGHMQYIEQQVLRLDEEIARHIAPYQSG